MSDDAAAGTAPLTIEEILAVADDPAYHRVVTAKIAMVPQALRDEHADLERELSALITDTVSDPERIRVAARLAELEQTIEASVVEFRFKAIGRRAWADLLAKHPASDAQRRRDPGLDHNPETFPYVAMAASCVSPVMTVDQVRHLDASQAVDVDSWTRLWGACVRANVQDAVPKSMAAGLILRQSAGSAATPVNGASLAQSSSAG